MDRRGKSKKGKAGAKRPRTRKSRKDPVGKVRDLEKRLAEAQKPKTEALEQLQTTKRELAKAQDQQSATSEILRAMSGSLTDVQPVLDAIMASAVRLMMAYGGALTRVTGDHLQLAAFTTIGPEGERILRAAFPLSLPSQGLHGTAISDRVPVNIADAQTDMGPRSGNTGRAIARTAGIRSAVAAPLLRYNVAVGTIAVTRREPGGFAPDEIVLLQTFADRRSSLSRTSGCSPSCRRRTRHSRRPTRRSPRRRSSRRRRARSSRSSAARRSISNQSSRRWSKTR